MTLYTPNILIIIFYSFIYFLFCHTLIIFATDIPILLTILIRLLTLLTILHLLTLNYNTCLMPTYYPRVTYKSKKNTVLKKKYIDIYIV